VLRLPEDLAIKVKNLIHDDDFINSDSSVIDVKPIDNGTGIIDSYKFKFDDKEYPSLLTNLPTVVETHKTFDRKIFIKSGEVGQVLHVFNNEKEKLIAYSKLCKSPHGDSFPHGLTPPTYDIVNRKFESTRPKVAFPPVYVEEVVADINMPWEKSWGRGGIDEGEEQVQDDKELKELIYEDVVEFEDWMVDSDNPYGISLSIDGKDWSSRDAQIFLEHPEILLIEAEIDEDKNREEEERVLFKLKEGEESETVNTTSLVVESLGNSISKNSQVIKINNNSIDKSSLIIEEWEIDVSKSNNNPEDEEIEDEEDDYEAVKSGEDSDSEGDDMFNTEFNAAIESRNVSFAKPQVNDEKKEKEEEDEEEEEEDNNDEECDEDEDWMNDI
jgi:hypothetical protein